VIERAPDETYPDYHHRVILTALNAQLWIQANRDLISCTGAADGLHSTRPSNSSPEPGGQHA
jgi:hypothetical protein